MRTGLSKYCTSDVAIDHNGTIEESGKAILSTIGTMAASSNHSRASDAAACAACIASDADHTVAALSRMSPAETLHSVSAAAIEGAAGVPRTSSADHTSACVFKTIAAASDS